MKLTNYAEDEAKVSHELRWKTTNKRDESRKVTIIAVRVT